MLLYLVFKGYLAVTTTKKVNNCTVCHFDVDISVNALLVYTVTIKPIPVLNDTGVNQLFIIHSGTVSHLFNIYYFHKF